MLNIVYGIIQIHSDILSEISQRLRNKGNILVKPNDMPDLPIDSKDKADAMERCLRNKGNLEYLVSVQEMNDCLSFYTYFTISCLFRSILVKNILYFCSAKYFRVKEVII